MRTVSHLCGLLLLGLMLGQSGPANAGLELCLGRDHYVIDLYRNKPEKFDGFKIRATWSIDDDEDGFINFYSEPPIFFGRFPVDGGRLKLSNDTLCKGEEINMNCRFFPKSKPEHEHWHCKIDVSLES